MALTLTLSIGLCSVSFGPFIEIRAARALRRVTAMSCSVVRDGTRYIPYIRCSASRTLRGRTGTEGRCSVWVELHERRVVLCPGESTRTTSSILAHFKVRTLDVQVIRSCIEGSAAVVSPYSSRTKSYCILTVEPRTPADGRPVVQVKGSPSSLPPRQRWRRRRSPSPSSFTTSFHPGPLPPPVVDESRGSTV